jgi:hypothetical protein
MMQRVCFVGAVLGWAACGCEHDRYEITMRREGAVVHRALTVCRVAPGKGKDGADRFLPYPQEKLAAFAKLYSKRSSGPGHSAHTFTGTFRGALPNDLGAPGAVVHVPSSMGHALGYVERFRGDDDVAGGILRQLKAADRLMDLLVICAEREFGRQKGFVKLRAFLDGDARRDLKNLLIYVRMEGGLDALVATAKAEHREGDMLVARLVQYLLERGYLGPDEVPHVARLLDGGPSNERRAEQALRYVLTHKVGLGDKERKLAEGVVAFCKDPKRAQASFEEAVRQSADFQARLRAWRNRPPADANAPQPTPHEAMGQIAKDLLNWELRLFSRPDELTVTFAAEGPPLRTNGEWDKTKRAVVWKASLDPEGSPSYRLPLVCYALWAEPDRAFQQAHFGRVVLEGRDLLDYCVWRRTLPAANARALDDFLGILKPGGDLAEQVRAFRETVGALEEGMGYPQRLLKWIAPEPEPQPPSPSPHLPGCDSKRSCSLLEPLVASGVQREGRQTLEMDNEE